jgi:hypothetical protein
MDNSDVSNSNRTRGTSPISSYAPQTDPLFSHAGEIEYEAPNTPPGLLRRLAGHSWKILLLWFLVSAPILFVIYRFVEPTYEAFSILRIEPKEAKLLETMDENVDMREVIHFLQTQTSLLTTDNVLNAAIANPNVVNLPVIVKSEDATTDLRNHLSVEIVNDAYLIRVALELTDGNQAATIVNAVVEAYLAYNSDFNRRANLKLTTKLEEQQKNLQSELAKKRDKLKVIITKTPDEAPTVRVNVDAHGKEFDPSQPTFSTISQEQYNTLAASLIQCDLEYLDAVARLEAVKFGRTRNQDEIEKQLESRIVEEFRDELEVTAIVEQIAQVEAQLEKSNRENQAESKQAVLSSQKQIDELKKKYNNLWSDQHNKVRQRLIDEDQGMLSQAKVRELEAAVEAARRKKLVFTQYIEKMQMLRRVYNIDTYEAAFLEAEIKSLMKKDEQIETNIAQLQFEASLDVYRVEKVDPAVAPKTAATNKYPKYMTIAMAAVFLSIFSLFLVHEINTGRAMRSAGQEPSRFQARVT